MEISSGLIKLHKGSEEKVAHWQEVMSARVDEILESLKAEGIELESWFKVELAGDTYLLWYMRAESIEKAVAAFQQSTKDIDKFHFETLSEISSPEGFVIAEPLLDVQSRG